MDNYQVRYQYMDVCSGGGGGCGIADYDGDAAWKLGRIMLRYRPIAPKPAAAGAGTAVYGGPGGKRGRGGKYGRRGRKARKQASVSSPTSGSAAAATPLMPETPQGTPSPTSSAQGDAVVAAPRAVRAAGAWVTVDRVTEAWGEEEVGACCSDEGVRRSLEGDACPGFLSDDCDRVVWINEAFRRMVVSGDEEDAEVSVALVTKGLVPAEAACRAFTCRVTVRYACRERGRVMLAAPCDVWRLVDVGLAWRVDVKAALSL